jgi:hypothetical protein
MGLGQVSQKLLGTPRVVGAESTALHQTVRNLPTVGGLVCTRRSIVGACGLGAVLVVMLLLFFFFFFLGMLLVIVLLMCAGILGLRLLAVRCLSLAVGGLVLLRLWGRAGLGVGQRRLSRDGGRGRLSGIRCLLWLSSFGLRLGGGRSLCLGGGRLGLRRRRHSALFLHVGVGRLSRLL